MQRPRKRGKFPHFRGLFAAFPVRRREIRQRVPFPTGFFHDGEYIGGKTMDVGGTGCETTRSDYFGTGTVGTAFELGHPFFPDSGPDGQRNTGGLCPLCPGSGGGGGPWGQWRGSPDRRWGGCGAVSGFLRGPAPPGHLRSAADGLHGHAGDLGSPTALVQRRHGGGHDLGGGGHLCHQRPISGGPSDALCGGGGIGRGVGLVFPPASPPGGAGRLGGGRAVFAGGVPAGGGRRLPAGSVSGPGAAGDRPALCRLSAGPPQRSHGGFRAGPCDGPLRRHRRRTVYGDVWPHGSAGWPDQWTAAGGSGLPGGGPGGASACHPCTGGDGSGRDGGVSGAVFAVAPAAFWRETGPAETAQQTGEQSGQAAPSAESGGGGPPGPLRQLWPEYPGPHRGESGHSVRPDGGEGVPPLCPLQSLLAEGVRRDLQRPERRHRQSAGPGPGPAQGFSGVFHQPLHSLAGISDGAGWRAVRLSPAPAVPPPAGGHPP